MRRTMILVAALLVAPLTLTAQRLSERDTSTGARRELERRFRERFGELIRSRLNLTDAQMTRLEATNRRFEGQRRELFMQEREVRAGMRDALQDTASAATQERVAPLIDRALKLQRQRLDLVESEQRELANFLTPVQRAQYFGMQEQLRRRVEEMRHREGGRGVDSLAGPPEPPGLRRRPFRDRPRTLRPDSLR